MLHDEQWVILGLASPRAAWFSQLARWATDATIPVEFIKCLSADEVLARINGGQVFSALLVGDHVSGVDRDLVDMARRNGSAVVAITSKSGRIWEELEVDAKLPEDFTPSMLMSVLVSKTPPISIGRSQGAEPNLPPVEWNGYLVAVTGSGGTGQSLVSMALAQAFAEMPSNSEQVLLADFARVGEQAAIHDAGDVIPGLQELVDAHRTTRLDTEGLRSMVFGTGERRYHLLLGVRQPHAWTVLKPRAVEAALATLGHNYRYIVADTDHEVEGEAESGSLDVEERNVVARTTMNHADLVVVVGDSSLKGIHSMIRTARLLADFGVPVDRMLPVLNQMPRASQRRDTIMEIYRMTLQWASVLSGLPEPVIILESRDIEDCIQFNKPLPPAVGATLKKRVEAQLDDPKTQRPARKRTDPPMVVPETFSTWTDQE